MKAAMKYYMFIHNCSLMLKPVGKWDGRKGYVFLIERHSNLEYTKYDTRGDVNDWSSFLCCVPISYKSKIMPIVALSVTEADLFAAVQCAQYMFCAHRIMNSMGLKVKLPIILYLDNKGAKDFVDNWSIGGHTRHIVVNSTFVGNERKQLHIVQFVGMDEYMVDELDTHKGRVLEVNNCEYKAGTYIPPDLVKPYMGHVNVMTPIVDQIVE
eukprot:5648381-Ditylum_brightwellii.AAC.1